ncbi:MAG TPA: folylpolyglutamate synthase/dihydrofolate synthase family protein [Lacipirellulaceae bacterium]|jgi:dihydrofolate synthase/folylpolyglutamate synthase|nr:folylpolyglutamate synthase/dihydrofolate synthase family protein [Lacipirellulaceae bacterium]
MPPNPNPPDPARTDAHPARTAALDWLLGRINYERTTLPYLSRQLKLDRMRQLLTRLGQPDAGLKIIHVAGTKGKGSTSAMIAAMLTAAGYRTGFFSSPHLERIEERFAVDGELCTADELVALVSRVRAEVRAMDEEAAADGGDSDGGPTYFEITTAIALLHFVERQADAAVLEVGLGGRLDSTNVCLPAVSVITSISFDHMRQLGNTLAAIAGEKAGIIKPGVPVVCGVTNEEPQTVIANIAREHGCRLLQISRDFHFKYHPANKTKEGDTEKGRGGDFASHSLSPCLLVSPSIDFQSTIAGQEIALENVELAMRGPHQAANAAIALATVAELRHQAWCISTDAMRAGLVQASLPGRVEILSGTPAVVLDTAHNPASARAFVETLAEIPSTVRRSLIVSISHDKDVPAVIRELVPHFPRIIVTQYQENPRAVPVQTLAEIVRTELSDHTTELITCPTPQAAWQFAVESATPGELFCITGSFFLAAEMRPLVLKTHAAETLIPVIRL